MFSWLKRRRRRKIQEAAWPQVWTDYLLENARLCRQLDAAHMTLLQQRTQVIVAEKHWEAVEGLTLTEEMQVTIAGQAALMLLGAHDFYFDNVSTIVVFPESFERETKSGHLAERRHHAGEAWHGGPVILSWLDVLDGGRDPHDGHNLVFHEFAHTLDGLDGEMGGNVVFRNPDTMQRWEEVSNRDFEALKRAVKNSQRTLLDPYGATNRAEFFAVVSEAFFEMPQELKAQYHELYELLLKYYRVDPVCWQRQRD